MIGSGAGVLDSSPRGLRSARRRASDRDRPAGRDSGGRVADLGRVASSAPAIAVRRTGAGDWPVWRELALAAAADTPQVSAFGAVRRSGARDTEAAWRVRLREVACNFALYLDDLPVGLACAVAPACPGGPIELIWLGVSPSARGRGVGSGGVAAVVRWAANVHPDSPVVTMLPSRDQRGLRLFEHHGFTRTGTGTWTWTECG
ncbi:MAG TPA: GNAT family N-acetyltransferase [Sporichthyaceae bacterium]|nr:GNAT family N-acetyltransferase [Sporichthyaceae bacterium]